MNSSPNRNVFGECRRCGGEPEDGWPSLTGADAADSRDDNHKEKLTLFRGEYMCDQCKQDLINDEQSLNDSELTRESEMFRARAGFEDEIST